MVTAIRKACDCFAARANLIVHAKLLVFKRLRSPSFAPLLSKVCRPLLILHYDVAVERGGVVPAGEVLSV